MGKPPTLDAHQLRGARPDSAPAGHHPGAANSPEMWDAVRRAGARILDLILEDVRPRDVLRQIRKTCRKDNAVTVCWRSAAPINTMST